MRSKLRLSPKDYQSAFDSFAKESCLTDEYDHTNLFKYGEFSQIRNLNNKKDQIIYCNNCFKPVAEGSLSKQSLMELVCEMNNRLGSLINYHRFHESNNPRGDKMKKLRNLGKVSE